MRRLSFGFIIVAVAAIAVAACGRQVTPNPPGLGPGGAPPGYMAFFFDTESPFNFSNYEYMFVLNTTTSAQTPSTDTVQTNWAGYYFGLVALGKNGTTYGEAVQFIHNANPHIPPYWQTLITTPKNFFFNANSNGAGTEFSMLVQQNLFRGISSPSPSPSPTSSPLSPFWRFNAFVTQEGASGGQWYFLDSMGAGGPVDPQFNSPALCITEPFDNTYYALYSPQDPAAQIVSVEIANNPASPTPCP